MKRLVLIIVGCLFSISLQAVSLNSKLISYGDKVVRVFENGKIETVLAAQKPDKDGYPEVYGAVVSPNQNLIAYIHDFNLWLFDVDTKKSTQLTKIGKPYSKKFASIEVQLRFWSSDGTKIFFEVSHGLAEDPEGESPTLDIRDANYGYHIYELATKHDELINFPAGTGFVYRWLSNGDFILDQHDSETRINRFIRYTSKPIQSQNNVKSIVESPPGQGVSLYDISNDSKYMLAIEKKWIMVQPNLFKQQEQVVQYDLVSQSKSYLSGVAESTWVTGSPELTSGFSLSNPTYSPSGSRIAYLHYEYPYGKKMGHARKIELVVDEKPIYSMNEDQALQIYWINESTIAIQKSNIKNQRVILVFDANTGLKKNIQIIE